HILITLLRNLEGRHYLILLELTFKFIKKYLRIKDMNTFPLPKIMYNNSLIYSLGTTFLRLIYCD
ncbi:hypothetical protein BCR34DRAFT_495597, partial [Clohesyomyces aquaticus]